MRYFVRPLTLVVISVIAISAWVVQSEASGSSDIRPLSADQQRATWGAGGCPSANVRNYLACENMLFQPCTRSVLGTCIVNCRDGCDNIITSEPAGLGRFSYGIQQLVNCGDVLGRTYNVRDCTYLGCCNGTITGNFSCNAASDDIWYTCGAGT